MFIQRYLDSGNDCKKINFFRCMISNATSAPTMVITITFPIHHSMNAGYTGKIHVRHGQSSFQFGTLPGRMISIATFSLGPEIYTRSLTDRLHQKFDVVRKLSLGVTPHKEIRRCSRFVPPFSFPFFTNSVLWLASSTTTNAYVLLCMYSWI